MLLGIMGASGLFGKRNITGIEVTLGFPREVYAGRPFALAVHLKNRKSFLPLFLGRVLVGDRRVLFPFVDRKGDRTLHVPFLFATRGLHTVQFVYLESPFPFSFFVRTAKIAVSQSIIAFPEPKDYRPEQIWSEGKGSAGTHSGRGPSETFDLASIRAYAAGDPFKHVNWKATAKSGELKTNLFDTTAGRPAFIDFDRLDIQNIEARLSAVTFTILDLFGKKIPVGLRIGDRAFPPALSDSHRLMMMKELALYD